MSDILDQARAALDGTTEGPWRRDGEWIDGAGYEEVIAPRTPECVNYCLGGSSRIEVRDADARFIAWARDGVPELIAEVERLRAQIAAVQALHHSDEWVECVECSTHGVVGVPWPCPTIQALNGETTA